MDCLYAECLAGRHGSAGEPERRDARTGDPSAGRRGLTAISAGAPRWPGRPSTADNLGNYNDGDLVVQPLPDGAPKVVLKGGHFGGTCEAGTSRTCTMRGSLPCRSISIVWRSSARRSLSWNASRAPSRTGPRSSTSLRPVLPSTSRRMEEEVSRSSGSRVTASSHRSKLLHRIGATHASRQTGSVSLSIDSTACRQTFGCTTGVPTP